MKKTPERIELLAAEYVLGSLQGWRAGVLNAG
jgi:anti-sigma-K factor RskA